MTVEARSALNAVDDPAVGAAGTVTVGALETLDPWTTRQGA